MNKTIQFFIAIDDVPLADLETIIDSIEQALDKYPDIRIQTSIQDEPMVVRR